MTEREPVLTRETIAKFKRGAVVAYEDSPHIKIYKAICRNLSKFDVRTMYVL